MLQDTAAGIPQHFLYINGERLWHAFAKLRLLQFQRQIAHEEILFHQPLEQALDGSYLVQGTTRFQMHMPLQMFL